MLFLDPPHETRPGPIEDSLHLYRGIMNDFHLLPAPPNKVDHLIRPGLERMSGFGRGREPKEVPRFDFFLSRLGLTVFIEDDTGTLSRSDDVEPFILVAVPVWDGADVVRRYRSEVNSGLGQAALVTEILLVSEDIGV